MRLTAWQLPLADAVHTAVGQAGPREQAWLATRNDQELHAWLHEPDPAGRRLYCRAVPKVDLLMLLPPSQLRLLDAVARDVWLRLIDAAPINMDDTSIRDLVRDTLGADAGRVLAACTQPMTRAEGWFAWVDLVRGHGWETVSLTDLSVALNVRADLLAGVAEVRADDPLAVGPTAAMRVAAAEAHDWSKARARALKAGRVDAAGEPIATDADLAAVRAEQGR